MQISTMTLYTLNVHDQPTTSASKLLWLPAVSLAMLVWFRRRKLGRPFERTLRSLLMLLVAVMALASMTGCGSGATFQTPVGADTVTVTATATGTAGTSSGNVTQAATISVNITN